MPPPLWAGEEAGTFVTDQSPSNSRFSRFTPNFSQISGIEWHGTTPINTAGCPRNIHLSTTLTHPGFPGWI